MIGLRDGIADNSVGFLRRFWGSRLMYALTVVFDALIDVVAYGLRAKYPSFASPRGLAVIARDRGIVRGIAEADSRLATRCLQWLDDRKTRGNPLALMRQIRGYCGDQVAIRIVNNAGAWHSLDANGVWSYQAPNGNWDWDGVDKWWRFWVIIYPNGLWSSTETFGETYKFGEETAFGSTITPQQCQDLIAIIRDWSAEPAKCSHVIIAFDPASFSPSATTVTDGTWGKWYRYENGVAVPSRLESARYFEVDHE